MRSRRKKLRRIESQGKLGLTVTQLFGSLDDQIDQWAYRLSGPLDRLFDPLHGMFRQQLQDADVGPRTGLQAVLGL